ILLSESLQRTSPERGDVGRTEKRAERREKPLTRGPGPHETSRRAPHSDPRGRVHEGGGDEEERGIVRQGAERGENAEEREPSRAFFPKGALERRERG